MKKNLFVLVAIVLILPLVLSACGGGPAKNAENFVKAMNDGDRDKAEKYACDDDEFKTFMDLIFADGNTSNAELDDLKCEEDGDNRVTCTGKSNGEESSLTFIMKDDKVCGFDLPTE
ncbi:MAG: DUF4878 domain-containing protein [Anaerolineales bacterium]|nr:DUF4878 domain-containing protein [Anaerolineales bacterium]